MFFRRHENPVVGTPLEIIANDEDVIVINKPASIPCHPCGRYRFNSIAFILGKEYGYPNLRSTEFVLGGFGSLCHIVVIFCNGQFYECLVPLTTIFQ